MNSKDRVTLAKARQDAAKQYKQKIEEAQAENKVLVNKLVMLEAKNKELEAQLKRYEGFMEYIQERINLTEKEKNELIAHIEAMDKATKELAPFMSVLGKYLR